MDYIGNNSFYVNSGVYLTLKVHDWARVCINALILQWTGGWIFTHSQPLYLLFLAEKTVNSVMRIFTWIIEGKKYECSK